MAIYECFESFMAFEQYLKESGPDLSPNIRTLLTEYCKYSLDRAWFYYPDALPEDILSVEIRNGHIDRDLSFPLEDLYGDGQPPGQVGQEIYGSGAAFIYASRSFHPVPGAPFQLFCDHFVVWSESGEGSFRFKLVGGELSDAKLSLLPTAGKFEPRAVLLKSGGEEFSFSEKDNGRLDAAVPTTHEISISWLPGK